MGLIEQIDEREITETIAGEEHTIPSYSPYKVRLFEVPDPDADVAVRRISSATKTGGSGSGSCKSGGIYTGMTDRNYVVEIDTAGEIGQGATFKWSSDGGSTWSGTKIPIEDEDPISLELGIEVSFSGTNFQLGDKWSFTAEYWTKVIGFPTATKQFYVNYSNGDIYFHSSDSGKTVQVSYEGRGTLVDAEDVNQVIRILNAGEVAIRNVDTSEFEELDCIGVDSDGNYVLADASDSTKPAIGFVKVVDSEEGEIVIFGPLDGFSNLTPGAVYYLSTTDGEITATPPSGSGNIRQKVGRALSATTLLVKISDEVEVVT